MKERLRIQGLRKRWILNSVGPVILILVLAAILASATVANNYYGSARSTLEAKAKAGADYFNSYSMSSYSEYYRNAVLWAVENGITKGSSDTTFSPNATCTRGQIVTFLWRSEKSPAAGTVSTFTDVAADAYCAGAVNWAVQQGITKGATDTTFGPNTNCTRAQIVTFLFRATAE